MKLTLIFNMSDGTGAPYVECLEYPRIRYNIRKGIILENSLRLEIDIPGISVKEDPAAKMREKLEENKEHKERLWRKREKEKSDRILHMNVKDYFG